MDDLLARRRLALAAGYELFYDRPLHLVRGEGVLLWDADGREYLDCYNNVPSVGHANQRVVDAICEQARLLNTHTRYLHENVVGLAERLGEKLGGDLTSTWLTCTGTESNDLAIQVARAVTGHHGVIVFDGSYHGNSTLVHALSPEDCPPEERPDWVIAVEPPNVYRGSYRDGEQDLAAKYASLVAAAAAELDRRGHGVAALLVDASWDANGVLIAPDDFLAHAAAHTRAAGGLVIADEVQAGYCRLGGHWWGHAKYGVVPDIVTMGKPMGGGHPVAACVTTPGIASEFAAGRGYFNTFGGNPVSAAAALAVIDVIDDDDLLANATSTGAHLGAGLAELAAAHESIGTVQGSGLFWGVDLVADPATREPLARDLVRGLVTDLAGRGVLTGVVGPCRNIVKIRPPLPFRPEHADRALEALDAGLTALAAAR
jgi:4-aminobutyrate aminotransferase-like enzyme